MKTASTIYTRLDGIAILREAIATKLAHYNGIQADPHSQVLVTSGATGALYATLMALLNPGDGVVMFEPFYGYHLNTLLSMRLDPTIIPMAKGSWDIDFDLVRQSIKPNTRAIIINTPSNPCGKVFTRAELETLATIVTEHDLFVITDEIYEYFLFDGNAAHQPGKHPRHGRADHHHLRLFEDLQHHRVGALAILPRAKSGCPRSATSTTSPMFAHPRPHTHGAAAGLNQLDDSFYQALSTEYGKKRDQLCAALTDAGMIPSVPPGRLLRPRRCFRHRRHQRQKNAPAPCLKKQA